MGRAAQPTQVPTPIRPAPVADVLGDLAQRCASPTWPRNDDEDFPDTWALPWSRCRDHLPDRPDQTELPEPQRRQLIQDFAHRQRADDPVSRSLAELLLDTAKATSARDPCAGAPAS